MCIHMQKYLIKNLFLHDVIKALILRLRNIFVKEKWILPFRGRKTSSSINTNFLWRCNNIYIMDNHRLALWCWLKEMNFTQKYALFHIDAHYDTASITKEPWINCFPDFRNSPLKDYLNYGLDQFPFPIINWGNYLSIFLYKYENNVDELFTATHLIGTKPEFIEKEEVNPYKLAECFKDYIVGSDYKCILNLDLDYFFYKQDDEYQMMFSNSYRFFIYSVIKELLGESKIQVLTICLSPECCGGWENAENICYELTDYLGFNFRLPNEGN